MPRTPHEYVNAMEAGIGPGTGDYRYPHPSAQSREPHGISNFVDGSGPIFAMYMEMATEEDKKMAENWKADADGILIFTGLFSAAVASLISVSIQDIRPNPQDTSNFYLANIYQTVANPNVSTSIPTSPPQFSPPNYAVWVNSLWFMSLVISLTCALLATFLQQWARRYLRVTQSRYSLQKRARIRAFFAEGVDKFLLLWVVETLPALLHISLFLFFAGLVVFLCNVNVTAFKFVLSWVGICTALYGCITLMPVFCPDSPYYTSLSSSVWLIVTGMRYVVFLVRRWSYWWDGILRRRYHPHRIRHTFLFWSYRDRYHKLLLQGMQRTAEETALNSRSEIDTRAFMWTFDCLDEDHELERFFSGLPGFRSSTVVDDPLTGLTDDQKWKLFKPLSGLLYRTFLSDLLPVPVKKRRAMICAKAIDPVHHPWSAFNAVDIILSNDQNSGALVAEILPIVGGWRDNMDEGTKFTKLITQATTSSIVARARRRDDPWFILASNELGVPESVLREYAAHGNSLSLAILIHIVRQQFSLFREDYWLLSAFSKVLKVASVFDVQDTSSPELQYAFCALWNQIVLYAQNRNDGSTASYILGPICNVYTALHLDTDCAPTRFSASTPGDDSIMLEPSSYPVCNVADHIHGTVLRDNAALPPASLPSPDAHSPSVPTPPHVDENPATVPSLDNSHSGHQTIIEGLRIPVASPDPSAARATRDVVIPAITVPRFTPDTSTSTPLSSTSLPAAVSLTHTPDLLKPSDPPNLPVSASSHPVIDSILPTGLPLPSHLPTTRPDLSPSFPESHRAMIATAAHNTSPGPTSRAALDLSTAVEDGGSHRDKDVGPPSVNRAIHANTVVTLDLPPPSSLPSVTDQDVAIASRSLEAEHKGDQSPHPSYRQYDIV